jgi:monovalent cation:proton antiporter-2 (CPA2) family protein
MVKLYCTLETRKVMHAVSLISWLLLAALTIVPLSRRLGLPSVIGYMLAGMLIGPHIIGVIHDTNGVIEIADFGIAMLLFLIGLELEPSRLWVLRRSVFGLGSAQVLLTSAAIALPCWLMGFSLTVSLVVGAGLAMSSTAFALQLLAEKNQLSAKHGRQAFAILLFQDIAVIPLLAIIPIVAGNASEVINSPQLIPVVAVFTALFFTSRFLVRPIFRFIANSKAPELFTGMGLFIIFGMTWLMTEIHLTASLGAFIAGVLLADSEYRHELEAQIQPFKGLLLGLFFMTVGMTANLPLLGREATIILLGALALVLLKGLLLWLLGRLNGNDNKTAIRLAVTLPQGGEFAFIVFTTAVAVGLLDRHLGEMLVLVVTISMAMTPIGFLLLEHVLEPRWGKQQVRSYDDMPDEHEHGHEVLIAGFGRVGQIVARVLRVHHIPFVALESSARQVDFLRLFGNHVYYGRPDSHALLLAAGAAKVKVIVLAIDDVDESVHTARIIRRHFPDTPVYARARDRMHAYRLMDLGVSLIHRETFASSLELASDVLQEIGFSKVSASAGVQRFREYDEELIKRQQAIYQDEAELVASAKQSMRELEELFASDARAARRRGTSKQNNDEAN